MKLGIIRCMQTEDYCPGSLDFHTIRNRKGAFEGEDDIQLIGFINCGGCPAGSCPYKRRLPGESDISKYNMDTFTYHLIRHFFTT